MTVETVSQEYLNEVRQLMINDYNKGNYRDDMKDNYAKSIRFVFGKKYIKIVSNGSASGFIVNTTTDKQFTLGDMLMAASWAAPARNFARGNVYDSESRKRAIRWTGVQ